MYSRFVPTERTQIVKYVKKLLKLHKMSMNIAV